MSQPEEGESRRRFPRVRVRGTIVLTLFFVGLVGGIYYVYYRKQSDYFAGRDVRLLSMITAQIADRINIAAKQPSKGEPCPAGVAISPQHRDLVETPQGWTLAVQSEETPGKCSTVRLDSVLAPVLARRVGSAFDMLIVAQDDAEGTVLYSTLREAKRSTLLQKEEEADDETEEPHVQAAATTTAATTTAEAPPPQPRSATGVSIAQLKALSKRKNLTEWEQLEPQKHLLNAASRLEVALGGEHYVLFAQPYVFANKQMTSNNKPGRWIVCGLISSARFRYEASAISTSTIFIAIAVVLLALCGWPFLRILLIDARQPLTITDVVLIVICTIVGAAVITLGVLDTFAYRHMSEIADEDLHQYSDRLQRDFRENVTRAMAMVKQAEGITRDDAVAGKFAGDCAAGRKQRPPGALLKPEYFAEKGAVADYPYIHSIFWMDDSGMQGARFDRVPNRLRCVADREYFQAAKEQRVWTVGDQDYVLEWVRSKTTGEVRAVFSKKAEKPFSVFAVSTELIDITHAVGPPGVEMAIIDERGDVVYHSDEQRVGFENFFAEADRNRDLRAAVIARRAEHLDVTYWGEDHAMFVQPLRDSAWTLVTFRPKRLTRVLNVEGTLLTLVLLLASGLPYLLLFIVVLLVAPRYRAARLWPDVSRTRDYLRLCVLLAALLLLFALDVYTLAPWSALFGILIIPNLAMVTTYLVLHRTGSPARYNLATAIWLAVFAAFVAHLVLAQTSANDGIGRHPFAAKAALLAAALLVAALTLKLLSRRADTVSELLTRFGSRIGYSRLYRLCGVLLLAVGVTMPVIGYFSISRHVQAELLVKYAQLRAAADLEHRIHHLQGLNAMTTNSERVREDLLGTPLSFFESRWNLTPRPVEGTPATRSSDDATIPAWAATSLPVLYEDSLAIRPLFESTSADGLWSWEMVHGLEAMELVLTRKIRLSVDDAKMLLLGGDKKNPQSGIVIWSALPHLESFEAWMHAGVGLIIAVPLLAIFWVAVTFIARRVLLIDVTEPDWLAPLPLSPSLGDHIFLVRRDRTAQELTGNDPTGNGLPYFDVSFEELDRAGEWDCMLQRLDSSEAGRNVRVVDFEHRVNDGEVNQKKLRWLERLLALPDRTIIVISTVTPAYVMTTNAPPDVVDPHAYFDRWRALLDRYVCITAEELLLRHDQWLRRQRFRTVSQLSASEPRNWLEKETAYNAFLRQLAKEIEAERKDRSGQFDADADREHLLDEIGERAETYFAGLWASCHEDEKLLLYQLAHDGLANGSNRRLLRRLIARGLVRRDPNLELFSESFRRYVLGAAQRENLVERAEEESGPSTWDSLRAPFFIVIISLIALLFATQKDLLTSTTALATALTTGLPILMKIVGVFTERRGGGAERA